MAHNPIINIVECCANCTRRFKNNKKADLCPYLECQVGEELAMTSRYAVCKFYNRDREEYATMLKEIS